MTPRHSLTAAAVAAAVLAAAPGALTADAGALRISGAWIRAAPAAAPTAAAYLKVTNRGREPDRLLGGSTPAAGAVEAHTMSMAGGVMRMRLASDGFAIPAGGALALAPGGGHLMLVGPRRPLKPGERVPITLRFARAGAVTVPFEVRPAAP